jgi:hypothetical protein
VTIDPVTPGKASLEEEVSEKSLTPAAQRQMMAKERAIAISKMNKSNDVQVGGNVHPYAMNTLHKSLDEQTETLLKSEFYHGASPSLDLQKSVLNTSVLCKSEGCGSKYSAILTACPECGNGTTSSRLLPRSGYMGGGNAIQLEKSAYDPIIKPRPVEADEYIPGDSPVVFRRR